MFALSPAVVRWAQEGFCLFLLCSHRTYGSLKYPGLQMGVRGTLRVTELMYRTIGQGQTPR